MAKKKLRKLTISEQHYLQSFCFKKTVEEIASDLCLEVKDIKDSYNQIKSKPRLKFDMPSEGIVSMTAAQSMADDETSKNAVQNNFSSRLANAIYRRTE